MNNDLIAVLDLETTGFKPNKDVIVEVGICELNIKTGEIKELLNTCVLDKRLNEKMKTSWIFENSSLRFDDVKKGIPIEVLVPQIQKIVDNYYITAYNYAFDFPFLKSVGIKFNTENIAPDPMIVAKDILKLSGFYDDYKWPKTQECLNYFKINRIEKHRAYSDTIDEAMIIYQLIKRNAFSLPH
jgi:DNA polymerase III alpha subunit (gram-positive type)